MYTPRGIFTKWLIDNVQNEDVPDEYSTYLRNARIDGIGAKIRQWYSQSATCPGYPVSHLGYWNMVDSTGANKNLLVYGQNHTSWAVAGQVGFYDISAPGCITALTPTKVYWLGPMTFTFATTPAQSIKFRAELWSFAAIAIVDANNNLVQQFDPSACTNLDEFLDFAINYPNETIADWNLITNGIIHVDYGDGINRDLILDFSGSASMIDVYLLFATKFDALPKWQSITTGYIKINGADVGPINLSTATTVELVSTAINLAYGSAISYIRYWVNDSGEEVPYIFFDKDTLTSVDRTTTGEGELLWELIGGDQLSGTSQFIASRLQDVRMLSTSRIYGSHSADQYFLYSAITGQNGFMVIDNEYRHRMCYRHNGIRPKIGTIFDSFHFISWDLTDPSGLYQSVRGYYEDFESPGSDRYTFDGPITALSTNNKEMHVFTKTSVGLLQAGGFTSQWGIYRFNVQQLETLEGALSQAGVVSVWNRTFFWTPSNKIKVVGRTQGEQYDVTDLSHREGAGIDLTMQYVIHPDQSKMFGVYVPKENIVKWYCRSLSGTDIDMAIIYDVEHDTFLVDTYAVTEFAFATQDGNDAWMMGRPAGSASTVAHKIYKDVSTTLDDTGAISFRYDTKRWNFWTPTQEKQFWWGRIFCDMANVSSEVIYQVYINGDKVWERTLVATVGSNSAGNRILDPNVWEICHTITKWMLRKKGKNIQFRFISTAGNSQVTLKDLSFLVLGLPDETSNRNISKY